MTRICYLVTSLADALLLPDKNTIFGYTPFGERGEAINAIPELSARVPLVGKLELPDESAPLPESCDVGYLSQLGFNPKVTAGEKEYGMPLRRVHLSRISVVPWDQMQQDVSPKEKIIKKCRRAI